MTVEPVRHYGPLIAPLFLPSLFMAVLLGISAPVLPVFLQGMGTSYALIGTIISARAIGSLLTSIPGSGVLARLSMRNTMMLGLLLSTVALVGLSQSTTGAAVFISWLCAGAGMTLYELARHQYLAFMIANSFRGRAVAVIGGIARLGQVVGAALGGWAAGQFGFAVAFLLMAGCTIVMMVIVLIAVANIPQQTTTDPQARGYTGELWTTLRDNWRLLTVAGSAQVLMQLVRQARTVVIPLYAVAVLGLDVADVGLVMSLGSAVDTVMFWPAGLVMDRFGRKAAIVPSLVLRAFGFLLLPLTTGFWAIAAVDALIGFSNGLSSGTMLTLGADLAPEHQRIPFLGIWRTSSALGFALGPNAVGLVAQALALGPASLAIGAISVVAALLFGRFVPETLNK